MHLSQENLSLGIRTRSDINRAVQPQTMARGLEFKIKKVERLTVLSMQGK